VPEDCNSAAPLSASDQFAAQLAAVPNMPHHPVSSYTKCPLCSLHCRPSTFNKVVALPCYSISIQFHCSPAPHPLLARNQPTADVNNFCTPLQTNFHPEKMTLFYISLSYLWSLTYFCTQQAIFVAFSVSAYMRACMTKGRRNKWFCAAKLQVRLVITVGF
jgi:hypothetical protein